jgi:hypothetical protein
MYDLHLVIHMFMYVADPGNAAIKSWLAPGCNQDEHGGGGHPIGDTHLIGCVSY